MAIYGTLQTLNTQTNDTNLKKGIDFLLTANLKDYFAQVSPGNSKTVEIDGRTIFAIFQIYTSKTADLVKIEGHRKYTDIQYIFEGSEKILLASANDISVQDEYNIEKDIYFPEVSGFSGIELRAGEAIIFTPLDLHGPGYCTKLPDIVKKVVIKVAAA